MPSPNQTGSEIRVSKFFTCAKILIKLATQKSTLNDYCFIKATIIPLAIVSASTDNGQDDEVDSNEEEDTI